MHIKNKNELRRRIGLFLYDFTPEEYKINEEFCKETMRMMEEFICCVNSRLDSLNAKVRKETVGQTKWIPVAKRMPKRNESVLLCMQNRSLRTGICIQTGSYDNGFWFVQGAAGYESLATFEFRVLAWMPLPEPYKGG